MNYLCLLVGLLILANDAVACRRCKAENCVHDQQATIPGTADTDPIRIVEPGIELVPIPKATFAMGTDRALNERGHMVTLTRPYWLSKTEVTVGQWRAIMGTTPADLVRKALNDDQQYQLDRFKSRVKMTYRDFWKLARDADPAILLGSVDDDAPMTFVTWSEAMEFCQRLTKREQEAGRLPKKYIYTLPSEAEWEFACRAGTTGLAYVDGYQILGKHNAPALDSIAWYGGNSSVGYEGKGWPTADWPEKQYPGGTAGYRKVGQKQPNAWGLYDMIGNVREWCYDDYSGYPEPGDGAFYDSTDPTGGHMGLGHVVRGGSWMDAAEKCRSAARDRERSDWRENNLGFRLALCAKLGMTGK